MFVRRSPNEQERLRHERAQAERNERLLLCRRLDRELAEKRRQAYKQALLEQQQATVAVQLDERARQCERDMETVQEQLRLAESFVGTAQVEAALQRHQSATRLMATAERWRQQIHTEDRRFDQALSEQRDAASTAAEQELEQPLRVYTTRLAEMERERVSAHQHYLISNSSLPSKPLQEELPTSLPAQQTNYLRRTTYQHGRTRYDDTFHHRDYLAISGQRGGDGSVKTGDRVDSATEAALRLASKTEQELAAKQSLAEKQRVAATERYQAAMRSVHMQQEGARMVACMAAMSKLDGQRKKVISEWVAAGERVHATPPAGMATRQKALTDYFAAHFPEGPGIPKGEKNS